MPLHLVFNLGIAISYYLIPLALFSLVYQGWQEIPAFFRLVILQFALFILACATGHLLEAFEAQHGITTFMHGITFLISAAVALQMPIVAQRTIAFIRKSTAYRQKLQDSETRFQAFMNCPKLMAWIKDADLTIIYSNPPLIEQFRDLVGTKDRDRNPSLAETTERNDREVIRTGQPFEYLESVPSADGRMRQWLSYKFLMPHGGEVFIGGIAIEITERERLREALEKTNQELEQFTYAASHDLRTPIRGIMGLVSILERRLTSRLDEQEKVIVQQILKDGDYANNLVDGILSYSRLGRVQNKFAPVDVDLLLQSVVDRLNPLITEKNAAIEWAEMPTIKADATQIAQVFENLITNALKYCAASPPMVLIDLEKRSSHWVFSVQDNGIGIDPDYQDQLFVMFKRLHGRSEIEGTGIGLATVKKIAQRHGGDAWLFSRGLGYGSIFYFSVGKHLE